MQPSKQASKQASKQYQINQSISLSQGKQTNKQKSLRTGCIVPTLHIHTHIYIHTSPPVPSPPLPTPPLTYIHKDLYFLPQTKMRILLFLVIDQSIHYINTRESMEKSRESISLYALFSSSSISSSISLPLPLPPFPYPPFPYSSSFLPFPILLFQILLPSSLSLSSFILSSSAHFLAPVLCTGRKCVNRYHT